MRVPSCARDRLDDRQAEADAGVVGLDAVRAALERFGGSGGQLVDQFRRCRRSANATAWLSHHGAEYGLCQIYQDPRMLQ